jgi:MFS family permease
MVIAIVQISQAVEPRHSPFAGDNDVVNTLAATDKLERLPTLRLILMTAPNFAYGLAICLSFNVIPEEAITFSNSKKGITYGMFCAIASCAQLTSPCLGHLSDRLRTPYGRRTPVIVVGSLTCSAAITGMWLASLSLNLPLFSIALGFMVVSLAAMSPALQALMRDIVPEEQIPLASAWSACTFALGCTASFAFAFWAQDQFQWQYAFCIGSTLLTAVLFVGVIKEQPLHNHGPLLECEGMMWLKQSFYFNFQRHPEFGVLLLTKVIMSGIAVSKTFNVYFIRDAYQVLEDSTLVSKVATISLAAEVVATLVTYFVTWFPVRPLCFSIVGALITAISWLFLIPLGFQSGSYKLLEIYGMVYGIGSGFLLVGDQALTLQLIPDKNNASRYTGLSSVAQFVGGVSFSIVDVLLLTLFGRTFEWTLPGPRAAPIVRAEDYRLEGFIAMFFFNALMSLVWACLYCRLGNKRKNEAYRDCWYSVDD